MSTSIAKFRLEEKIRLSYLRSAGNLERVSKECDVPYEYTKKICDKFKKRQQRDVNLFVASTIAEHLMFGSEHRKSHLINALNEEINKPMEEESVCHNAPIRKHIWDDEEVSICQKCDEKCITVKKDRRDKKYILKLIKQLREEDSTVVEFLIKLGFTNKPEGPQVIEKTTNYNLLLGNLSGEDQKLLQDAKELDPRSREMLRHTLESRIVKESEFEETKQ